MDEKLRKVKPYGYLYTMGKDYFLLSPHPIVGDSWEGDNTYRFLVVPMELVAYEQRGSTTYQVFGCARHVVTNCFSIEYVNDVMEIHIPVLEEIGSSDETEEKENGKETDDFPF